MIYLKIAYSNDEHFETEMNVNVNEMFTQTNSFVVYLLFNGPHINVIIPFNSFQKIITKIELPKINTMKNAKVCN